MEQWYVLHTKQGQEAYAESLVQKKISPSIYSVCRVLKKKKIFRSGGVLHILEDVMFPGYLFIKTDSPEELVDSLKRARNFPQMIEKDINPLVPVEQKDICFLKAVCGEELDKTMGVTAVRIGENNEVISAKGILNQYLDKVVKINLHKRFALAEVELFHRKQKVLFSLFLENDQIENSKIS